MTRPLPVAELPVEREPAPRPHPTPPPQRPAYAPPEGRVRPLDAPAITRLPATAPPAAN